MVGGNNALLISAPGLFRRNLRKLSTRQPSLNGYSNQASRPSFRRFPSFTSPPFLPGYTASTRHLLRAHPFRRHRHSRHLRGRGTTCADGRPDLEPPSDLNSLLFIVILFLPHDTPDEASIFHSSATTAVELIPLVPLRPRRSAPRRIRNHGFYEPPPKGC